MESTTARSRKVGLDQTEFAFRDGQQPDWSPSGGIPADAGKAGGKDEVQSELSADAKTIRGVPPGSIIPLHPSSDEQIPPVWLQRLRLVIFVVFCIQLGLMLVVLPWKLVWNMNSLLADLPAVRAIFQSYFVRGLVTGLGLIDIWIGVAAAVSYRDQRPPASRQ